MTVIGMLVFLIIVGAILYCVSLLPIDATIKRIVHTIAVVLVLLWLLEAFGLISGIGMRLK